MADTPGRFLERNASLMLGVLSAVVAVGWFAVSQQITNAKLEILTAIDAKYATKEGLNELKQRVKDLEDHRRYTLGSSSTLPTLPLYTLPLLGWADSSSWRSVSRPWSGGEKTTVDGAFFPYR